MAVDSGSDHSVAYKMDGGGCGTKIFVPPKFCSAVIKLTALQMHSLGVRVIDYHKIFASFSVNFESLHCPVRFFLFLSETVLKHDNSAILLLDCTCSRRSLAAFDWLYILSSGEFEELYSILYRVSENRLSIVLVKSENVLFSLPLNYVLTVYAKNAARSKATRPIFIVACSSFNILLTTIVL